MDLTFGKSKYLIEKNKERKYRLPPAKNIVFYILSAGLVLKVD